MRRRLNGFDVIVIVIVVIGLLFIARRGLKHTVHTGTKETAKFTIESYQTRNASSLTAHMTKNGTVSVFAGGALVPIGKLQSLQVTPYRTTVANGKGGMVVVNDPIEKTIKMVIVGPVQISGGKITINGNPFYIGQSMRLQEGSTELTGEIVDVQRVS